MLIINAPFRTRTLVQYCSFATFLAGLGSSQAALAQRGAIEEITVTAQFREQNLQDTPLSISAVSGDMLESRGQTQLTDIAAQMPNVVLQVNPAGGGNAMRAYIRGVGQADQSPSVDPGVGIYIDDVYFSTISGSVFDLMDLDRVEVMRGPQGTLAGMNSMGGAVRLYSRKPRGEGGYVEGTRGAYNRTDIKGAADFTIIPDQLFARISGVSRHQDGYVDRYDYACANPEDPDVVAGLIPRATFGGGCKIGTMGGREMSAVKLSLNWMPTDDLEVNFHADYTHDKSEVQPSVLRAAGEIIPGRSEQYQGISYNNRFVTYGPNYGGGAIYNPYATYANFTNPGVSYQPIAADGTAGPANGAWYTEPANHLVGSGFSGTVDWQINENLSLKSITAYRSYETLSGQDNDGSPVVILQSLGEFEHEQLSQEFRLSGIALDGLLDFTVGGIYYQQETVYASRQLSVFVPNEPDPTRPSWDFIQDDTTENNYWAVFAHGIWHLNDRMRLATGLRYTDQDKDYTFNRFNVDGQTPYLPLSNPSNPLNGTTGNFNGSNLDYRLNLSFDLTDHVMVYAEHATGFKGGGISPRPYFPEQVQGFDIEKLYAYEVGTKGRYFDNRLQLNASVFYNDYRDYQQMPVQCVDEQGQILPVPFDEPCGQYQNVADAKVWGTEIEVQYFAGESLRLDASWSYLDFEFQEPFIETPSVVEGASAPGVGDIKWSLGAQYTYYFGNGAELSPRVDVNYMPEFCTNMNCNIINDDYTLVNARINYISPTGDWNVALEGSNLSNEVYTINQLSTVYESHQIGPPRMWALSIRRRFN